MTKTACIYVLFKRFEILEKQVMVAQGDKTYKKILKQ
jgi:hypothetical protein